MNLTRSAEVGVDVIGVAQVSCFARLLLALTSSPYPGSASTLKLGFISTSHLLLKCKRLIAGSKSVTSYVLLYTECFTYLAVYVDSATP